MDTTKKDPFATTLQSGAIISDKAKGGTGQVITPAPIVPSPTGTTLSASNIGTQPVVFPTKQETPIPTLPTASINEQAKSFAEATQVATPTPAETAQTEAQSTFQKLSEKMFGKSAAQAAAETTQGIPEKSRAVSDIQSQINQLQNEATQQTIALQGQGRGITTGVLRGQAEMIERQRSIKALQLNSFLYAAQGNLATAQDMADKAVAAEFDPIEAQIKYTKDWLDMNKDNLSREDKKRADALTLTLNERTRLLNDQKAEKTAVNNIALEAAKNGVDAVTLNNISKAKTAEEALGASGKYLGADTLDKQYKELQIKKLQQDIAQTGGAQGVDENIIAYAQQYATTGTIPTGMPKGIFGKVAEIAKATPRAQGEIVNRLTGVKDSKLPAAQQEDFAALYDITQKVRRLKELNKPRIEGLISAGAGKLFGSEAQSEYLTLRKSIVDDIARMQTGAALTLDEQAFYNDYLPGRVGTVGFIFGQNTQKKIENFEDVMNERLKNRSAANSLAIYGYTPVKLGDKEYKVGDTIEINGVQGRVLPDGKIAIQ